MTRNARLFQAVWKYYGMKKANAASFDFNKAARKVIKDHPSLRGRTLFIHAANDDFADIEQKLLNRDADEDDIEFIGKVVRDAKRLKTSYNQEVNLGKKSVSVLVFHPDKFPVFGRTPGARDDAGTFDHETGHALSPETSGTLSENTADAYAALRHLQRFDGDTEDLDYAGWKRAAVFMLRGTTSHLTTLTLDKISIDAKTAGFMSLSPAGTLQVAKDYAKKNTPSAAKLASLREAFKPMKGLEGAKAFRALGKITLKAKSGSDAFYLGARVLQGALQEGGITLDGEHIELKGREWNKLRQKLSARIGNSRALRR